MFVRDIDWLIFCLLFFWRDIDKSQDDDRNISPKTHTYMIYNYTAYHSE